MMKDHSSWKDLHVIERALLHDVAFKTKSYYWDLEAKGYYNFFGVKVEPFR